MKKILVTLLVLSIPSCVFASSYIDRQLKETRKTPKYNSVKIYKQNYLNDEDVQIKRIENLKDPKLIKLSDYTPIDDKDFKTKLSKDEAVYKKQIMPVLNKNMNSINIEPAAVDFYKVYRISERLIRANNLDYVNWRVAIRKSEDVNAATFSGNYIIINTALYDSVYTNDDALAFVIAHEMAHQILGHNQRQAELERKLERFYNVDKQNKKNSDVSKLISNTFSIVPQKIICNELQSQELMADSEALILLSKAGYSTSQAMETLNFLAALPNIKRFLSTHPVAKVRIANAKDSIAVLNPDWVYEGRENIYDSEVLPCKKSSDRVSIIISKSDKDKNFYQPEDVERRLTRIAYMNYLNGDMENAIKYFEQLAELTGDYVPFLYLSYANEYMYEKTNNQKYLKNAIDSIEQASVKNSADADVKVQLDNLKKI